MGQGAADRSLAVHGSVDLDGTDAEGTARVPIHGQAQPTVTLDEPSRRRIAVGAGETHRLDHHAAVVQTSDQPQPRRRSQQPVQFADAEREAATPSVEGDLPGRAGARHRGGDRSAESPFGAVAQTGGVGDLGPAAEAEPAEQVASARAGHLQRPPLGVQPFEQDRAVGQSRRLEPDSGSRAQQAPDHAGARAAGSAQISIDIVAAVARPDIDRPADTLRPIAGQFSVEEVDRAVQGPAVRIAAEPGRPGRGPACRRPRQPRQRRRRYADADAARNAPVADPDPPAGAGTQVFGHQPPADALQAVVVPGRRNGQGELGGASDAAHERLQQVRARKVREAGDIGLIGAVSALDHQRGEIARPHLGVDDLAIDDRIGEERLVRRIAQCARDGAAPGLPGAQVEAHVGDVVADRGGQTQEVAGAAVAVGVDRHPFEALARDERLARQLPASVFLAEALQQFDVSGEAVNVDGQRLRAWRFGRGLDQRAADQADDVRFDVRGVEAAGDQRPPVPVDPHLARLEPYPVGVGHRHPIDGEVVEQVSAHALDVDASVAPQLLAGDEARHQAPTGVGQQIHPSADRGHQQQGGQDGESHAAEEGDGLQPRALLPRLFHSGCFGRFRRGRRFGQNACPMLT